MDILYSVCPFCTGTRLGYRRCVKSGMRMLFVIPYIPLVGKKKPMKDWKTCFIQMKYLGLSNLLVPWTAELASHSHSTCRYPLQRPISSTPQDFCVSVWQCSCIRNLSFAVSTSWDPAALWWTLVDSEIRHVLEYSTWPFLCNYFQKKPGYTRGWCKLNICPTLWPGHI